MSNIAADMPVRIDMGEACRAAVRSGVQWATESSDLDLTLLSWEEGQGIAPHVNDEVDVVWIGIEGTGVVTIDGTPHELRPGVALLLPRGCQRALVSTAKRLGYLSLHQRRRGLQLQTRKKQPSTI